MAAKALDELGQPAYRRAADWTAVRNVTRNGARRGASDELYFGKEYPQSAAGWL